MHTISGATEAYQSIFGDEPASEHPVAPKKTKPIPWYVICMRNRRVRDETCQAVTGLFKRLPVELAQMAMLHFLDSDSAPSKTHENQNVIPFNDLVKGNTNLIITDDMAALIDSVLPRYEQKLKARVEYYGFYIPPMPAEGEPMCCRYHLHGKMMRSMVHLPNSGPVQHYPEALIEKIVNLRCPRGTTREWIHALGEHNEFKVLASALRRQYGLLTKVIEMRSVHEWWKPRSDNVNNPALDDFEIVDDDEDDEVDNRSLQMQLLMASS